MKQISSAAPSLRLTPFAAAIFGAFGSFAAHAQADAPPPSDDGAQTLPTITVIGEPTAPPMLASPKSTAPLLDTPQTVTVIPAEVFNQQGAQNLTDVLGNTPGISFNAGENGFGTNTNNFSLRGVDTSGSIFIDGARDSGNYSRDVFNLEQVEVVKGPAADNGRGGAGGYVNLVTKTAQLGDAYRGTASYGFDETDADARLRATVDLNKQLGAGSAVRLNLLAQDGGVAGREHVEKRTLGFAPSVAFGLDGPTRYILSYQYLDQDDRPDWGVPSAFIDGMSGRDPSVREKGRDNFYGLLSDFDEVTAHSLTARIEHTLSPGTTISNQTRWGRTERDAQYTVPTGYDTGTRAVTTQAQLFQRENTSISNLTNLGATFETGPLKHTLAAGLEFSFEESESGRFPTAASVATDIDSPDPRRAPAAVVARTQTAAADIDTIALYVYDTVELNRHWKITAGVRGERYKARLDSRTEAGAPLGGDDFSVSETTVGGKLGVVFKPADNGSIYAAVGLSSLPPGSFLSNPDISREGDNALPGLTGVNAESAKAQRAINYEVGTKWELFDERLTATAALFRTQRRNVAITGREDGETVTTLKGYGRQIIEGFELGATGRLTENWTVFGGLARMKTERRHSAFLDEARCRANPTDYQAGAVAADCPALVAGPLSTNGDALAFSPELSATLWTTYRLPMGLTIGGGVQHVDESWLGRPDDAERIIPNQKAGLGKLPDYTVFNLMAAYEFGTRMTLRLNVDNLTDELYAISANWSGQRVTLGDPRTVLLSVDFRF